jgi:hypothetical protein
MSNKMQRYTLYVLIYIYIYIYIYREREREREREVHRVLVGKPEGKRPLGRPRRRWENNIEIHLQEVGGGSWGM